MPPEEADSTEGTAKPRQLAEPEECPGGAKIKPPFEMGVSDLDLILILFTVMVLILIFREQAVNYWSSIFEMTGGCVL